MTPSERRELIESYNSRLRAFGHDPRTLGWNKPKHILRYAILLEYFLAQTSGRVSLLDFGCGFGDLFAYCRANSADVDYHGVDINPSLIEVGQVAYPEAHLWAADPLAEGLPDQYDVIVASGTHNRSSDDPLALVERTLALFAKHARIGFAINFLSDRASFQRPANAYMSASRVLELASRHSPRVVLRHDYMPFEFTLIVDLRTAYDPELTVYPEFLDYFSTESGSATRTEPE